MSSVWFGILYTIIAAAFIVTQVAILVVAAFFWRQYKRPSLYLALMAALELLGAIVQTMAPVVVSHSQMPLDPMIAVSLGSLGRLSLHTLAMCFLVLAVYVARKPNSNAVTTTSPLPGTPGMENADQAFLLDPKNPYSPPRQPR